jgi:hypothetical protein
LLAAAGHRIYSHSEPLQILTINLKRDCVGDDCGEGWMEGNNGTKTTKEIIKKKVQSQVPSNIDIGMIICCDKQGSSVLQDLQDPRPRLESCSRRFKTKLAAIPPAF